MQVRGLSTVEYSRTGATRNGIYTERRARERGCSGAPPLIYGGPLLAARSLEGATMPNGQKYEEWLKSKGSGEE